MKNENETQNASPKRLTSAELVKGREYYINRGPEKGVFICIEKPSELESEVILFEDGENLKPFIADSRGYVGFADSECLFFIETTPENE